MVKLSFVGEVVFLNFLACGLDRGDIIHDGPEEGRLNNKSYLPKDTWVGIVILHRLLTNF